MMAMTMTASTANDDGDGVVDDERGDSDDEIDDLDDVGDRIRGYHAHPDYHRSYYACSPAVLVPCRAFLAPLVAAQYHQR